MPSVAFRTCRWIIFPRIRNATEGVPYSRRAGGSVPPQAARGLRRGLAADLADFGVQDRLAGDFPRGDLDAARGGDDVLAAALDKAALRGDGLGSVPIDQLELALVALQRGQLQV